MIAHGTVHILDDLGNREPGLAAVDDGEDRIAPLEQLGDKSRTDRLVGRKPTAADHPDDGRAIGAGLGREDVHRERRAKLAAVDDVDLLIKSSLFAAATSRRQKTRRETYEKHF